MRYAGSHFHDPGGRGNCRAADTLADRDVSAMVLMTTVLAGPAAAQINAGTMAPETNLPFVMTQVTTFNLPWRMAFLPDGRMLVTEKVGPIWLVTQKGEKTQVQNVPSVLYGGQGGMLGMFEN